MEPDTEAKGAEIAMKNEDSVNSMLESSCKVVSSIGSERDGRQAPTARRQGPKTRVRVSDS